MGAAFGGAAARSLAFAKDKNKPKTTISAYKEDMKSKTTLSQGQFEIEADYRDQGVFGGPLESQKRSARYTVGLRAGTDTVATLVSSDNPKFTYTSFSVLDISVDDQEIISVNPAQDNSFFVESSGRASRTLRVNGALLNADKFEWFKDWMTYYDSLFRSSRMLRRRAVSTLTIDGVAYHGLIFNFTASKNADQENAPMFGFSFLVMDITPLKTHYSPGEPLVDTNYFTDFSTNFFGLGEDGKTLQPDGSSTPTEVIGYRRKESKPGDKRLLALGAAAVSMADPAKWAAMQGADKKTAAAGMVGKAGATYGQTAGSSGGILAASLGAGMGNTAAMAIAGNETKASFGAKMAEAGLSAAESFTNEMLGGVLKFGVGEKFAPGRDYDKAKFNSGWRGLVTKLMDYGFSAARMGISRHLKGGMASVNFGVTTSHNSPTKDVGFTHSNIIAGANVVHTQVSLSQIGTSERQTVADVEVTDVSVKNAKSAKDQKVGPMLGFTPSVDNETHVNPFSMVTITTPPGSRPAKGGDPEAWGPIFDL